MEEEYEVTQVEIDEDGEEYEIVYATKVDAKIDAEVEEAKQPAPQVPGLSCTYAAPTQEDVDGMLNTMGGSAFTYNYNKLTRDTHSTLIKKLVSAGKRAYERGEDFAPTFISQVKHLVMLIDIHGRGEDIATRYVDNYCSDILTVMYKVPISVAWSGGVHLPGSNTPTRGPAAAEGDGKYMYLIHPVRSMSELYLEGSGVGESYGWHSSSLTTEELVKLGKEEPPTAAPSVHVPRRMMGMSLPFTSTATLREIIDTIAGLVQGQGDILHNMEHSLGSISAVLDVRYKKTSYIEEAHQLMQDMLTKKLCGGCPNALICFMANGDRVSGQDASSTKEKYEQQLTQHTCVENYYKHFLSKLNMQGGMLPQKMLLAQYQEEVHSKALSDKGYLTQPMLNLMANLLRNATKPEAWLAAKVASGAFLGPTFSRISGGKVHGKAVPIQNAGVDVYNPPPVDELKNLPLERGGKALTGSYYPESYDKRIEIHKDMPRGVAIEGKLQVALKKLVVFKKQENVWSRNPEGFHTSTWRGTLTESDALGTYNIRQKWADKGIKTLLPMLKQEGGKYYLVTNTSFNSDTMYQAIARTTKAIKAFIALDAEELMPLGLKELKFVATSGNLKLGEVLARVVNVLHAFVYQKGGEPESPLSCEYKEDCVLGSCGVVPEGPHCAMRALHGGITASDFAAHVAVSSNLPCRRAIKMEDDLVKDGAEVVYTKVASSIPGLDMALRVLAVYIDDSLKQKPSAGSGYSGGLSSVFGTDGQAQSNPALQELSLQAIALCVKGGVVLPLVIDPELSTAGRGKGNFTTQLMRLRKYVPTAFHAVVNDMVRALHKGTPKATFGEITTDNSIVEIPENQVIVNNTVGTGSPNYTVLGANLLKDEDVARRANQLTAEQLMFYEMIKARVLPPLIPVAYPEVIVEVGLYRMGLLRIQRNQSIDRTLTYHQVLSLTLYNLREGGGDLSSRNKSAACHRISDTIQYANKHRKELFKYRPKAKYIKDASTVGYVLEYGDNNMPKSIHVRNISTDRFGGAGSSHGYYNTTYSLIRRNGSQDKEPLVMHRLADILAEEVSEEAKAKLIRLELYAHDFNVMLGLYWLEHGKVTSNLGLTAIAFGGNEGLEKIDLPKDNCMRVYNDHRRESMASEKYINHRMEVCRTKG